MEIRPARTADCREIAELLTALGYPATPAQARDRLGALDESDCVLIGEGGLIAMRRVPRLAEGTPLARITALAVAPERRGKGVGRALLSAAEDVARGWGCALLEVSSGRRPERGAAHAFYRATGFDEAAALSIHYWKRLERR
ncbi:MAG: GNAT family N-acetyltransferase [Actinomycetota bacterium]|nr:GNAT family N-acetyltransferase [Actinomycetota bacterium]